MSARWKPRISEEQWQAQIIQAANLLGWIAAHFRPALDHGKFRTAVDAQGKGFPDLVLVHVRGGDLLIVEAKRHDGKLRPDQEIWAAALRKGDPTPYRLWRPEDWPEVEGALKWPNVRLAMRPTSIRAIASRGDRDFRV